MNAVLLCMIVGALISSTPTFTADAAFLQVPDPLNVTVGVVAKFFCRADADAVVWTVNGTSVKQLDDPNISPDVGPEVDGVHTQILRIIADVQYNTSMIQCVSITLGEEETPSDPALLMVQGLLSPPTEVQANHFNSSTIKFFWNPPFTLDITNEDTDIHFIVSITNTNTSITEQYNVTEPELMFHKVEYNPCDVYLFRVSAWNPVGMSNSDGIEECFGGAPQSAIVDWNMSNSSAEERITFTFQLIIIYDMTCHGRQPESINTTLTLNNGSQMQIDSPKLNETGRLDYLLEFSVDNTPCGINVTIKNQFGNNHTYVLLANNCQVIVIDDGGDANSSENNLAIPIAVVISGAVISLVIVLLLIFIKCRGAQDNIKDLEQPTKDNEYVITAVPVKDPHYPERQASSSSSADSQTALTSEAANSQGSELQYAELDLQQQRQIHQNAPPPFQPVAYIEIQPKTEAT